MSKTLVRFVWLPAVIASAIMAGGLFGASPATAAPGSYKQISTPGKYSQWAYVEVATYAYSRPSKFASKVTKVPTRTSDKTDNVVYIDGSVNNRGLWYRVLLPSVHGTWGWVPASRLGAPQSTSTQIVIDLAARSLTLIKAGRTVLTAGVGIGKAGTPTPPGDFYIRSKMRGFSSPAYGVRAMGTSAKSKVLTDWPGGGFVGIHGTNEPGILPGRVSHGCVRVRNETILRIYKIVSVGTPVTIK